MILYLISWNLRSCLWWGNFESSFHIDCSTLFDWNFHTRQHWSVSWKTQLGSSRNVSTAYSNRTESMVNPSRLDFRQKLWTKRHCFGICSRFKLISARSRLQNISGVVVIALNLQRSCSCDTPSTARHNTNWTRHFCR